VNVGVAIGRFQVPKLHSGHIALLQSALLDGELDALVVLVGVSPLLSTRQNPLDYATREAMIRQSISCEMHTNAQVMVLPLFNCPTDEEWSAQIDRTVTSLFKEADITIYWGPDSSIRHYNGRLRSKDMSDKLRRNESGTKIRQELARKPRHGEDFRAGVIYGAMNRYDPVHSVVDVAPWRHTEGGGIEFLMGRKKQDGGDIRFIGGFVDKKDFSLSDAASRELGEEARIFVNPHDLVYVGSANIEDWRYRAESESIISTLFTLDANSLDYEAQAADDLDGVDWYTEEQVQDQIHIVHYGLWTMLRHHLRLS
jgi:bifunctional NMN adenylyltransferase/nudix hydrolase